MDQVTWHLWERADDIARPYPKTARMADPEDRRVKRVELTEKVLPCFEEVRRTGDAVRLELLRGILPADVAAAHKVLLAIRERS